MLILVVTARYSFHQTLVSMCWHIHSSHVKRRLAQNMTKKYKECVLIYVTIWSYMVRYHISVEGEVVIQHLGQISGHGFGSSTMVQRASRIPTVNWPKPKVWGSMIYIYIHTHSYIYIYFIVTYGGWSKFLYLQTAILRKSKIYFRESFGGGLMLESWRPL